MGYAKEIPKDKNGAVIDDNTQPAVPSLQSQNGVPIASSVISLNANTTVIDVTVLGPAGSAAIIGKWGTGSVTGTNFDWIATPNHGRTIVVPINTTNTSPTGSIAGANVANGLYNAVAVKTATAQSASIFTAEY